MLDDAQGPSGLQRPMDRLQPSIDAVIADPTLHPSDDEGEIHLAVEVELRSAGIEQRSFDLAVNFGRLFQKQIQPLGVEGGASLGRTLRIGAGDDELASDRKSTRLNSSHVKNSYAVFCLKKKRHKNTFN